MKAACGEHLITGAVVMMMIALIYHTQAAADRGQMRPSSQYNADIKTIGCGAT